MAILEWKKLDFFNVIDNADNGRVNDAIRDSDILCSTGSFKQKIICDSSGYIHVFYHNWYPISFVGHHQPILLCALWEQSNLFVTLSETNRIDQIVIKIWDLIKIDKLIGAPCIGSAKAITKYQHTMSIAQFNGYYYVGLGTTKGEIFLFRGIVGNRDHTTNLRIIYVGNQPVTGIVFQIHSNVLLMFASLLSGIYLYKFYENYGKEERIIIETSSNVPIRCCDLLRINCGSNENEFYFVTGRDDAVYCYNSDSSRGPCYAIEGQKQFIKCFTDYWVIVINQTQKFSIFQQHQQQQQKPKECFLIVIDIKNKFIALNVPFESIINIFSDKGNCFVLTKTKCIYQLIEKDIKTKLNLLYGKNLYDIAIRLAKDEQLNDDGVAMIHLNYGDYLYTKGDYMGATERYIYTIGYIEPSIVIKKFSKY